MHIKVQLFYNDKENAAQFYLKKKLLIRKNSQTDKM